MHRDEETHFVVKNVKIAIFAETENVTFSVKVLLFLRNRFSLKVKQMRLYAVCIAFAFSDSWRFIAHFRVQSDCQ